MVFRSALVNALAIFGWLCLPSQQKARCNRTPSTAIPVAAVHARSAKIARCTDLTLQS
jgi:hypothetical protein